MPIDSISQTALAVLELSEHMDRLRKKAILFQEAFETGHRGYFSPSEDDEVSRLWISYHKARNALLETVNTLRQRVPEPNEATLREFLVGYAATLILIDAARFLRDVFGGDAVVRRKLNESYQIHGIAADSFDAIQMSLTDPANAVQIERAGEFYDSNAESLHRSLVDDASLDKILKIIEGRRDQARVSRRRYVQVRAAERSHNLRTIIVQGGFMKAAYAIQEWGSKLVSSISTMPNHVPQLPHSVIEHIRPLLRPGDVFVTRKENAFTNYFLPGYWPHVAMYVGNDAVIESLKDGVRRRGLDSPFGNDAVAVVRPKLKDDQVARGIARAETHIGKPYDFDFDFTRSDRMVCTEVVYRSYEGIGPLKFPLVRRAGRETFSAEDLLMLTMEGKGFAPIAVYCPQQSDQVLTGPAMLPVLKATVAVVESSDS